MSLELLNTLATLATCLIVATTAIAALVQLRHLRASNQIEGQLAINGLIQSVEFRQALMTLRGLSKMMADPRHAWAFGRRETPDMALEVIQMIQAASVVGSNLENVGNMVRNGLTDQRLFIEQFGNVVSEAWDLLEPFTRARRKASPEHDTVWEDFENLTILSRDWAKKHGSAYPKNRRRLLPAWSALETPGERLPTSGASPQNLQP